METIDVRTEIVMESEKKIELPWDDPEHDIMKDLIDFKQQMKDRHYSSHLEEEWKPEDK